MARSSCSSHVATDRALQVSTGSTSSSAPGDQGFHQQLLLQPGAVCVGSFAGSSFPQHLTSSAWIQHRIQVQKWFNRAACSCKALKMQRTEQAWPSGCHGSRFQLVSLLAACHAVTSSPSSPLNPPWHCRLSCPSGWVSCVQDVPRLEGWPGLQGCPPVPEQLRVAWGQP